MTNTYLQFLPFIYLALLFISKTPESWSSLLLISFLGNTLYFRQRHFLQPLISAGAQGSPSSLVTTCLTCYVLCPFDFPSRLQPWDCKIRFLEPEGCRRLSRWGEIQAAPSGNQQQY